LAIRGVVGEVDLAVGPIHREAVRIAQTHGVDLGPRVGGAFRKQIAFGNCIRAIGLDADAQELASQVIRVRGRPLRVKRRVAIRPLVDRRVTAVLVGIGVVARGKVQIAGTIEVDVSAGVAADAPVHRYVEDGLLAPRNELIAVEAEAG
jgi:hypothetical protein